MWVLHFVSLSEDWPGYSAFIKFPREFRISLSTSANKSSEILIWFMLNLLSSLGNFAILVLRLLIHKHGMSFHLFSITLISFIWRIQSISSSLHLLNLFLRTYCFWCYCKLNCLISFWIAVCIFFLILWYGFVLLSSVLSP